MIGRPWKKPAGLTFGVALAAHTAVMAPAVAQQSLNDAVSSALANDCLGLFDPSDFAEVQFVTNGIDVFDQEAFFSGGETASRVGPLTDFAAISPRNRQRVSSTIDFLIDEGLFNGFFATSIVSPRPTVAGENLSDACSDLSAFSLGGNADSANVSSVSTGDAAGRTDTTTRQEAGLLSYLLAKINAFKRGKKEDDETDQRLAFLGSNSELAALGIGSDKRWRLSLDGAFGGGRVERDTTALEAGFDGRSLFGRGAMIATHDSGFAIGVGANVEDFNGDFTADPLPIDGRTFGITVFGGKASTVGAWNIYTGLAGSFAWAEQAYSRNYVQTATFDFNLQFQDENGDFPDREVLVDETTVATLSGEIERDLASGTAMLIASRLFGQVQVSPRASVAYLSSDTDEYSETGTGFDNAFALRYAAWDDEWVETRLGLGIATGFTAGTGVVIVEAGGDWVHTFDAQTPTRSAFFVEDLRSTPTELRFDIDNLDTNFAEFDATVSYTKGRVRPYIGGYARVAHDYLTVYGGLAGINIGF